jgi:hypothetical protein
MKEDYEEELIKMFNDGYTDTEIGEVFGISKNAARRRRQRLGLKLPMGKQRKKSNKIELIIEDIPDPIKREEVQYLIDKHKRLIAWAEQQKEEDKFGKTPAYYRKYDEYIYKAKQNIERIMHPTPKKYAKLMSPAKEVGEKSVKDKPDRYNIQADIYLRGVLNMDVNQYWEFKEAYLKFPGWNVLKYYDFMFNEHLPKHGINNTFNFVPELVYMK